MNDEQQNRLFQFIPSEFEIDGHSVNFSKRYSSQFVKTDLPAIVLTYIETGIKNFIYFNKLYSMLTKIKENTESFETESGVLEYEIDEKRAHTIVEVEGYVDDDWKTIDDDAYFLNDDRNIEFQTEDDLPDYGTEFDVSYEYYEIDVELGGEFTDRIQIDVVTSNYEEEDVYINGLRLCKIVTKHLMKELRFGFEEPDLNIRMVTESTDLTEIEGEDYHYRHSFDIEVAYHDTYLRTYDSIEQIKADLELNEIEADKSVYVGD